jgi:uncharacterized protein YbbC (DUF1343 family)
MLCPFFPILAILAQAAASPHVSSSQETPVKFGLDVLLSEKRELLEGRRIGVIANHSSLTGEGEWILDALDRIEGLSIKVLFTPEHGLSMLDESTRERWKHLRIVDLYGKKRRPDRQDLAGLDALLYDMQDVGCRFYTYTSTMLLAMDAASEAGREFFVLDRPNPLGGVIVEGPVLLPEFRSFVGMLPIPIRYGLTAGELALFANGENCLPSGGRANLTVIPMQGWKRTMYYDDTGLPWVPPSSNIPKLESALLYPGLCLLEGTNLSEGRGTMIPFTLIGAPWLASGSDLGDAEIAGMPGVSLAETTYIPQSIPGMCGKPKYLGQEVRGFRIRVTDRESLRSFSLVVRLIGEVAKNRKGLFEWTRTRYIDLLAGGDELRETIEKGEDLEPLLEKWDREAQRFREENRKYFLYGE